MVKSTRRLAEDWGISGEGYQMPERLAPDELVVGRVYHTTPRFKVVASCFGWPKPHMHAEDADGYFTICTEDKAYQQMAARALYEAEHDL